MRERTFRVLCTFGGSGLGGLGCQEARVEHQGVRARFELIGGFDIDQLACEDFRYLTGVEQLCADVETLTLADIRRAYGRRAPDMVFTSSPCQGGSKLLSGKKAKEPYYKRLNRLSLVWAEKMCTAWDDLPALLVFENVPGLPSRAPEVIEGLFRLLRAAGYVVTTGFHDAGALGGLAQSRRRWLMVARLPSKCPQLLYQPEELPLRGCGEVLEQLPVPATVEARAWGPMHTMPEIHWVNWVRLALIPAGGDWRDLEGVLAEGQARRELFKRHAVEDWSAPTGTIAADPGSNGVCNVADPLIRPQAGNPNMHWNKYHVTDWSDPALTVSGAERLGSGAPSVGDPRPAWLGIPVDELLIKKKPFDAAYGVLAPDQPARTVATENAPGCGAYAYADPRLKCAPRSGAYGVLRWDAAAKVVTGSLDIDNGFAAVADPRPHRPPPFTPVIIAKDGTWHRPLTILELAALQGFPLVVDGKPLKLAGNSRKRWASAIGNAVPAAAARAIAEQMLMTLIEGATGGFSLRPSTSKKWVRPQQEALHA